MIAQNQIKIIKKLDAINILGDEQMLERVLINLLTNAVYSFTEEKERIIEISYGVENQRKWITLIDNGQEIDKEIEEFIFVPFYTTRKEGAGIGLPLAKNIMDAHGGYIEYIPQEKGAGFKLVFV